MINYETILSLFDDKLTLLQYLTKIEEALKNEKLTNITVTQTDASHVYFTFVFEDGSTIDTPTFTLPAGPQGIQGPAGTDGQDGADGVSVTNAEIDASGHLILTLSNGNTIDAGATGLQTVTASDVDSETATQYEVLKANGNGGATWGRVTDGDIADNRQVGQYLGSTGYGFAGWKKFEVSSGQVNSSGGTQGQVLTADGNGGASWEDASGGGSTLYEHNIRLSNSYNTIYLRVITSRATVYTTLNSLLADIYSDSWTGETVYLLATGTTTVNSVQYVVSSISRGRNNYWVIVNAIGTSTQELQLSVNDHIRTL